MVDKHLDKVFPLDVEELGDGERPVEGELNHVVPPHLPGHAVVRIIVPKTIRICPGTLTSAKRRFS